MPSKLAVSLVVIATALVPLLSSAPAQAQASRTWVSGLGNDGNPCSITNPCQTFAGALMKTAPGGEINCLDPGGFGTLTINVSITIDCGDVFGSILASGTDGIDIIADNTNAPVVRLRRLSLNGAGTGTNGIRITGGATSNTVIFFEDIVIDGFAQRGITDERTGGGYLVISNATIKNNGGTGVNVGGIKASVDRLRSSHNAIGVAVGTGGVLTLREAINAANTSAGIETEGTALAKISNTEITGNAIGIQVVGGTVVLNNSDVSFNPTGVMGTVNSYSSNRFFTNGGGGTIMPIGTTSNPTGMQ